MQNQILTRIQTKYTQLIIKVNILVYLDHILVIRLLKERPYYSKLVHLLRGVISQQKMPKQSLLFSIQSRK